MKVIVALSLMILACSTPPSVAANTDEVSLTSMVRSVKRALIKVRSTREDRRRERGERKLAFDLESVRLDLSVGSTVEAGGKVSFYVFEAGGSRLGAEASTISLVLVPPDPDGPSDVTSDPIADALVAALVSAADAVDAAGRGQPPLVLDTLTVTLEFRVETNGEAGVSIAFPPFGVDGSGAAGRTRTQTIEATFR